MGSDFVIMDRGGILRMRNKNLMKWGKIIICDVKGKKRRIKNNKRAGKKRNRRKTKKKKTKKQAKMAELKFESEKKE